MASDENHYKRTEDLKWRELTDERIKNLTTDMTVVQDRIEYQEARTGELLTLIRGDASSRDEGLNGDIQQLQRSMNRLNAMMIPDTLGHGGIPNRLLAIEKALGLSVTKTKLRWQFLTAVAVAAISTAGLLLNNWDKLKALLPKDKPTALDVKIEKAKHRKGKPIVRYRVITPAEETSEGSTEENVQ